MNRSNDTNQLPERIRTKDAIRKAEKRKAETSSQREIRLRSIDFD